MEELEGLEALRSPGLCVDDVEVEGWEFVLSFSFLFPPVAVPGLLVPMLILEAGRALLGPFEFEGPAAGVLALVGGALPALPLPLPLLFPFSFSGRG